MAESGIYEIVNLVNGKRYVGSAVDFRQRWWEHQSCIRRGKHHNIALTRAFEKYGTAAFEFRVIEECEPSALLAREQYFIDTLRPEYNCCLTAGSTLGLTFGAETRKRVGDASRRAWEDPSIREKLLAARRSAWDDPERRRKGCEAARRKWADPDFRAKVIAARSGLRNGATDHSIYTLVHADGRVVRGIQLELRPATGLSPAGLTQLLRGNQQTAKGWRVASS